MRPFNLSGVSIRGYRVAYILMIMTLAVLTLANVPTVRDAIFPNVIHSMMRGVSTWDIVRMKLAQHLDIPDNMTAEVSNCQSPVTDKPARKSKTKNSKKRKSKHMKQSFLSSSLAQNVGYNESWDLALKTFKTNTFQDDVHRRFLPVITMDEKQALLQVYQVFADALKSAGVQFFLVGGSLLGAYRHHGMIPWDDDIDVGVSLRDWDAIRHALGCIPGYGIYAQKKAHWKFFRKASDAHLSSDSSPSTPSSVNEKLKWGFPFVDMFFYAEDDRYMWAVTNYLLIAVLFRVEDVYPLSEASFEGLTVPVPHRPKTILTRRYTDLTICVSPKPHRKLRNPRPVTYLPCRDLSYLYNMFQLDT